MKGDTLGRNKSLFKFFESHSFDPNSVGQTILLHGAMVSDFNGVSLNGGDIMINPTIHGSKELETWWLTNPVTNTIREAITPKYFACVWSQYSSN